MGFEAVSIFLYFLICPVGVTLDQCHFNTPGVEVIEMTNGETMELERYASQGACMMASIRQMARWEELGEITLYDDSSGWNEQIKFLYPLENGLKPICRPATTIGMPGSIG